MMIGSVFDARPPPCLALEHYERIYGVTLYACFEPLSRTVSFSFLAISLNVVASRTKSKDCVRPLCSTVSVRPLCSTIVFGHRVCIRRGSGESITCRKLVSRSSNQYLSWEN